MLFFRHDIKYYQQRNPVLSALKQPSLWETLLTHLQLEIHVYWALWLLCLLCVHCNGLIPCRNISFIVNSMRKLECGTWYHHPRRLQCVLSRNLIICKVATWHYGCRHNLKNNCIWDNLQCCLLVLRSPSKPVMLTFDLWSRKVLFIEIVFWHV